jgi:hypothetical protein
MLQRETSDIQVKLHLAFRGTVILLDYFENKVLRKVFGPNRNEVAGEWERLHNE